MLFPIQRYGIELQGWTYKKLVNPSELSTAVGPLQRLLDAIKGGDCKFIKLTAEGCQKHLEAYKKKIALGELKVRDRKVRSDAGIRKRKRKRAVSKESDKEEEKDKEDKDEDEQASHVRKGCSSKRRQRTAGRSAPYVSDSGSD
jgi:hypothetical protein